MMKTPDACKGVTPFAMWTHWVAHNWLCLLYLFEQPEISVGRVQLNFLHLLSSEAVQHVIIHCLNFSVWQSDENRPAGQASVKFKAWTGEVFEAGGELEPDVIEDSCWVTTWKPFGHTSVIPLLILSKPKKNTQWFLSTNVFYVCNLQIKDGRWHQTHFVFHSLDPVLLPVVDVFHLPKSTSGSHYHLEIGPVCFLWGLSTECFDRDEMDHHLEMTRPCGRGGWSALPLNVCRTEKKKSNQIKHPSECEPSSEKQPPVGLQTQSEGEQGAGMQASWGGAEEFLHY